MVPHKLCDCPTENELASVSFETNLPQLILN